MGRKDGGRGKRAPNLQGQIALHVPKDARRSTQQTRCLCDFVHGCSTTSSIAFGAPFLPAAHWTSLFLFLIDETDVDKRGKPNLLKRVLPKHRK